MSVAVRQKERFVESAIKMITSQVSVAVEAQQADSHRIRPLTRKHSTKETL